jgi:hypothetical protein
MSLIAFHKDIDDEGQSVYIDYTRINITKVDSETGEVVCGAEISLCDEAGNVVDTWITEEEPHYLENVPAGKYTLVENAAPNGYEVAETLSIVIEDVPELQSFTMEDDVIKGNIHITKIDSDNQDKKLSGVKFVLFKTCETVINTSVDRDIVSAWENIADSERENINGYKVLAEDLYIGSYVTDDNGEFSVEGLTYGTYYLVETETQKGYTMLSDITGFVIDEENLDNDITISNEGRIGWITYQITTRTVPGADNIVKTGDDSPILLIIAIILLILGIPVYRYGSKKIKKWHMIIPLAFMLVPVTHMSASAKENTDTTEYVTVDIESYVDSEYAASEPEHDSSIDYTYTYSETGETYKVQLPYTGKKLLESGYVVPVTLTGTIYDYNAEYFMCNGIKYDNPGDDLSRIEDILVSFVESEGYSADSYRNLSYDFSGEAYEDSDGLLCRDFKLTFDTYGVKFRFYYGKTFDDLVSVAKTESTLNSSDKQFDNTTQTNAVLEKEDDTVAASTQETTSTQESVSNQTVADDSAASQDVCSNAENESILENNQEEKQETSQETTETSSHTRLSATRLVSAVILMVIICGLCVMLVLVIRKTGKK